MPYVYTDHCPIDTPGPVAAQEQAGIRDLHGLHVKAYGHRHYNLRQFFLGLMVSASGMFPDVGRCPARMYDITAYPLLPVSEGNAFREPLDTGLGRGIAGSVIAAQCRIGTDINDRPAAVFYHQRDKSAADPERRFQINIHHTIPALILCFCQRIAQIIDSGDVADTVQSVKSGFYLCGHALDIF